MGFFNEGKEYHMRQRTGNEIRQLFLDYFAQHGHMIEPSASLVPVNDPTLLWINAGVAALKKYFDGSEKPRSNRIANAQKSIRTNDIENVGRTARHLTFFEMLGNFSIGDYFKKEAIPFAWHFLTDEEWIGFDKDRMYITVYEDDDEAYRIWTEECHVDPSHILRTHNNFWEIGKGPGGPDSEIFYDRGPAYDPEGLGERAFFEELDNDRYIEVWNVVFSQYDCDPELDRKEYKELPQKNIDTGMGLERLVTLVQDGATTFDTDLFLPIIRATEQMADYPYEGAYQMAYRVIADHIRTLCFALSDGANFSNTGRGYVLRRLLRRAVRYGLQLGLDEPFLYRLVRVVADNMDAYYPYLQEHVAFNEQLIQQEEQAFKKTLRNGQALLDEHLSQKPEKLAGEVVFKLYDTYGFPVELTKEIAQEAGVQVDMDEFYAYMQEQKDRARQARQVEQSFSTQNEALMNCTVESEFIGYDQLSTTAKVVALFDQEWVILDQTPFYAESGGQASDTGWLVSDELKARVTYVKKAPHGQPLHQIEVIEGSLKEGMQVQANVDYAKRMATTANHSATHLLQAALKEVVGSHIAQAGSYNNDEYLRFDFTHFEKVTDEQLCAIERRVNEVISQRLPVSKVVMSAEQAKQTGATALFSEKYGDQVRVVSMGEFSKEFCGGCHVNHTGEIGLFKIVSEESVGSDIRRISAKTGFAAYQMVADQEQLLKEVVLKGKFKTTTDLANRVEKLVNDLHDTSKKLASLEGQMAMMEANQWIDQAETIGSRRFIAKKVTGLNTKQIKDLASQLKGDHADLVVLLYSTDEDKLVFVCGAGQATKVHAGQLVKLAAEQTGGKGGGKPDLAQAGGQDFSQIDSAIAAVKKALL